MGSGSDVGSETESPQPVDEQQPGDESLPGDEAQANDEAQSGDEAQASVPSGAHHPANEANDEAQSGDEAQANDEAWSKDEEWSKDKAWSKDGEWPKDEEWSDDKDAGVGSGAVGVVEGTARLVEDAGGEVVYVEHPGRGDRTVLALPAEFVDGETPLIVTLHGYGGDSLHHSMYLPLHERVNDDGFALLLPNALPDGTGDPAWNPTDECCDGGKAGEDDVAYLTELVAEAVNTRNFGPVYFFGYSNGGFMAYHMACKALTGLRAVVSLAGTSYVEDSSCDGAPPVSALHIHGTADNVILYEGYETGPDPEGDGERAFYAGAEEMVTRWSRRAGCDWPEHAQPHARLDLDHDVPGPETQVLRPVPPEPGCAEGISIELWSGVDSGHGPAYGAAFMDALLDWLLSQN